MDWKAKGIIQGMEKSGAVFVKIDSDAIYFDIPQGSELRDEATLKRGAQAVTRLLGLKLKVKKL